MDDDFNTPEAIAVLFDVARELNRAKAEKNEEEKLRLGVVLRRLGNILGLLQFDPEEWAKKAGGTTVAPSTGHLKFTGYVPKIVIGLGDQAIQELITKRNAARKEKNWKESDRISDELKAQGVILEDRPDGATDIGPTPPGTGVIQPARRFATAKSTSPTSLPSASRLMPTSMTMAPGVIHSPFTSPGLPTATTTMSARATCSLNCLVKR